MAEDSASTAHKEALAMLDAFASVGATSVDVARTTSAGDKDSVLLIPYRLHVPVLMLPEVK